MTPISPCLPQRMILSLLLSTQRKKRSQSHAMMVCSFLNFFLKREIKVQRSILKVFRLSCSIRNQMQFKHFNFFFLIMQGIHSLVIFKFIVIWFLVLLFLFLFWLSCSSTVQLSTLSIWTVLGSNLRRVTWQRDRISVSNTQDKKLTISYTRYSQMSGKMKLF